MRVIYLVTAVPNGSQVSGAHRRGTVLTVVLQGTVTLYLSRTLLQPPGDCAVRKWYQTNSGACSTSGTRAGRTAFRAVIAASSIDSSGSRVVSPCRARLGARRTRTKGTW